jgi:prephenate dehydrogenase
MAIKAAGGDCEVVGYGHRLSTLERAIEIGAIDRGTSSVGEAVEKSDLILLCTPVGVFESLITEMQDSAAASAVISDVGSTKRSVVRMGEERFGGRFVGSHPMAGSEKRGVEFARADLYQNALCILTPTSKTDPAALEMVEQFWKSLGMRLWQLSPDKHDRLLADVSHLPHALAAAVVAMQSEEALPLAGKGFLDATRIAGGDGALWRDILLDNRDNLKQSLGKFKKQLEELERFLDRSEGDALVAWLDAAARRRRQVLTEKLREVNPD